MKGLSRLFRYLMEAKSILFAGYLLGGSFACIYFGVQYGASIVVSNGSIPATDVILMAGLEGMALGLFFYTAYLHRLRKEKPDVP